MTSSPHSTVAAADDPLLADLGLAFRLLGADRLTQAAKLAQATLGVAWEQSRNDAAAGQCVAGAAAARLGDPAGLSDLRSGIGWLQAEGEPVAAVCYLLEP